MFDPVSISKSPASKKPPMFNPGSIPALYTLYRLLVLVMEVEMIGVWRSLEITFLKRFAVPHPVSLLYEHVIHMYWDPYIAGGVGDLIVNVIVYYKVICFKVAILNIVYTGSVH
jgi:hypothetical protein